MLSFLVRRVLQLVFMLFSIVTLVFFLLHIAPGGPIVALTGDFATLEYQIAIERLYGLDRPLHEQYANFVWRLMNGDLGQSYIYKAPVIDVVLGKLPATLLLTLPALVISSLIGVWLGAETARKSSNFDISVVSIALILHAVPIFWFGQLLLMLLAVQLDIFPVSGMIDARASYDGWRHWLDVAHHLALPCLTLIISQIAFVILISRSSLKTEMNRPYFLTARARGNSLIQAQYRHALPNALLPIITLIGNRVGWIIASAILVENVYSWPGLGRLIVTSSINRDYPVILGTVIVAALLTLLANLIVDLIYIWIDPRIKQGSMSEN